MNLQTWSTKRSKEVNEVKVSAVSHLDGSDGLVAGGALGREDPVEVVDAVDLVVEVDGEGDAVEALVAHAAPEAAGVERLAHRLQDLGGGTGPQFRMLVFSTSLTDDCYGLYTASRTGRLGDECVSTSPTKNRGRGAVLRFFLRVRIL